MKLSLSPEKFGLLSVLILACSVVVARGTYQEPEEFLAQTFSGDTPEPKLIWLTGERKDAVKTILGHHYSTLRIRYWKSGERSAWILDEIGKDQPITTGVVINTGRLEQIKVLVFRESRGWEIRHPFFTNQFKQAQLNGSRELDRNIDGISGATLSVRAMKKLAALALYLDAELRASDVPPTP